MGNYVYGRKRCHLSVVPLITSALARIPLHIGILLGPIAMPVGNQAPIVVLFIQLRAAGLVELGLLRAVRDPRFS